LKTNPGEGVDAEEKKEEVKGVPLL